MIAVKQKPETPQQLDDTLCPIVKNWFKKTFQNYSLPQLYGVYEIHSRNNVLVCAPTGATKTLTAFLAILNELVDLSEKKILSDQIYCLYVSPLKALNYDIHVNLQTPLREMEQLAGKKLGIRVAVRTGDTTAGEKAKMLKKPPHILITTPESLAIMLSSPKFRQNFKNTQYTIIDEIHALAENKRGVHLALSLERLEKISGHLTRIGLSATVSPLKQVAEYLAGPGRGCKIVDVKFIKKTDLKVLSPVPDLIDTEYEQREQKLYELLDSLIQSHKTTLIFTNTRSATERVVHHLKQKFPKHYTQIEEGEIIGKSIGAHHGSLSKQHRFEIEKQLREGKLKAVVCSTSLELGIDIGYIDLVVLLSSPKSVSRALQRTGRAGHRYKDTTKGRLVVLDRDDLVECSVLLKSALDKKIDQIHIPTNCLDVLAQQLFGISIEGDQDIWETYETVKKSYCYKNLSKHDYFAVLKYLAGEYSRLQDRHVYGKIWLNEEAKKFGRRGKMSRVIYMTNVGTIPDQHGVTVKAKEKTLGRIDETFLERLKRGDIFVLGGECYEFLYSRGMVAQVNYASGKRPTVPSWYSEMLPLSYDLGCDIQHLRRLVREKLEKKTPRGETVEFLEKNLYVGKNAAQAITDYFTEQHEYLQVPDEKNLLIEHYQEPKKTYCIFHAVYGRRVNDALSRAVAYVVAKTQHRDVEIGVNDNGFYLASEKNIQAKKALETLLKQDLRALLEKALDSTEVLKRRFRHCAARSLMILSNYKGKKKRVGRQQVSSMILLNAVKEISEDFPILKEARREVLEDLMDVENAEKVLEKIRKKELMVSEAQTQIPSPFSFNLVASGYSDILKAGDKIEFLKRMHQLVLAKISLEKGKRSKWKSPTE